MKKTVCAVLASTLCLAASAPGAARKGTPGKAVSSPVEKTLEIYAERFLPFDPESKITVTRSTESLAGFRAFHVKRKGRYEKLNTEKTVYVSEDGKWFFAGDTTENSAPRPVRSAADLEWLNEKLTKLFRTSVRSLLVPERDAGGLKGVTLVVETGYGGVRLPGYVTADGKTFLQGTVWDFRMDPREERRRRIDLSAGRATGPADATVNVVEYADMECPYCKFRGLQMDRLLETNTGIVNVRRHYKFFVLWMGHVWAMKAASAADCIFKFAGQAMFRFKSQVYARQETMTLAGIDELALAVAEADGISSADFLSCYLREESFARVRKDMEEGHRLGVNSTPTYYINGTEIAWVEDKVMEDFLRTLFPKMRSISYESKK